MIVIFLGLPNSCAVNIRQDIRRHCGDAVLPEAGAALPTLRGPRAEPHEGGVSVANLLHLLPRAFDQNR